MSKWDGSVIATPHRSTFQKRGGEFADRTSPDLVEKEKR